MIEEEIAKIRPIDKEHQVVQIFTQVVNSCRNMNKIHNNFSDHVR